MSVLSMLLVGAVGLAAPADPVHVTGGGPAGECVWPTTVAVKTSGGLCTGSLVHPSVVVYAAHCGASDARVLFGQHADAFELEAEIDFCETNPEYLGASNAGQDWAYCRLAEPVDVPITPPLYGCETDAIEADLKVHIAGYGYTSPGMGNGGKHWAETTIISTFGNTATIGGDGASTCPSDSGGSAFIRLDDGGWRAISMVSAGVGCESATHALMHPAVPWIEERSGVDITPCHDVDGTWAPGSDCGGFYAGETDEEARWEDACADLSVSEPASSCGAAWSEGEDDDDDASDGDDSDGDGDEDDDGASDGEDVEVSGADEEAEPTTTEDDAGGCRVGGRAVPLWILLPVLAIRRRRAPR